jgi:hypothetical protein
MAVDDVAHRTVDQGKDETLLGRWAWIRRQGRQGHHLRIVSAYRPVDNLSPGTVYAQHGRYLHKNSCYTDKPRTAFYRDLSSKVAKWKL